jgi:DNA invertase Pin-like site-specific DNA recombinase
LFLLYCSKLVFRGSTMHAVAYFRVSTLQQGESGLGLAAQKELVLRFLGNDPLLAEFTEVESGKRHKNRPQLLAALDLCKRKKAKLVIAKLDRLSRNVAFIADLMESRVEFVCCDNPHATPLHLHIQAAFAQHERETISLRIKEALAQVKRDLATHGTRVSKAGKTYTKLGGPKLAEARARAATLRRVLLPAENTLALMEQLRVEGASLRAVAAHINAMDIRTPQGSRWYASTVRAALRRKGAHTLELDDAGTHERNDAPAQERNHTSALTSFLPEGGMPGIPSSTARNALRGAMEEGSLPMPSNLAEAERMLDLFTSVGARSFVVTKTDVDQNILWGKPYSVRDLREKLPAMVRTAAIRKPFYTSSGKMVAAGENLIIRPTGPEVAFIQLDDLNAQQLEQVRPAAFLMHETSPGNHQAWVAVSDAPNSGEPFKAFMRRVRKAIGGNDKSASHATRLGGTENFKEKFFPDYPVVRIIHAVPGRVMMQEQLQNMGLLAEPEPVEEWVPPVRRTPTGGRSWPDYTRCLAGAPPNRSGSGPDRSLADYTWCKFAAQRGWSIEEIAAELPNVSEKARERIRNRDPGYVTKTAENGAAAAQQKRHVAR